MTLNNAITSFRSNANCIVDDPSHFNYSMWLDPTVRKFVPLNAFNKPLWDNRFLETKDGTEQRWQITNLKVRDCPNVIGYRRNQHFYASSFLSEDAINWGSNKGTDKGRSVLLAALKILFVLGFGNVYLVGVDFEMKASQIYHFPEEKSPDAIFGNMAKYNVLNKWLTELQPHFLAANFLVKNCNPESRLRTFPFVSLDKAIIEATAHLGSYSAERTEGMYKKKQDKV